jgi:hypothetical protein
MMLLNKRRFLPLLANSYESGYTRLQEKAGHYGINRFNIQSKKGGDAGRISSGLMRVLLSKKMEKASTAGIGGSFRKDHDATG